VLHWRSWGWVNLPEMFASNVSIVRSEKTCDAYLFSTL